ncbi:MAG: class I SAM-dependent methyltransferase [Bacteroidetes bacterium]|nr:class I SAM-dependent methyltransferase [Bacteroidota bacterium]
MRKCVTKIGCTENSFTNYSKDGDLKFEKCDDCGLIWRTEDSMALSKDYEQEYFDSKKYDKRREHKVKKSGWLIDIANLHHKNINSILEVGCSIGYTLEAAKNRGIKHLGIDISKFAVDYCNNIGLNASNATFDELKADGKKVDLIFKQHVLEHFKDPFNVLKDCHELLNEQGLILILVPNSNYKRAHKNREKHRFYSKKGVGAEHYVYFNYTNLTSVLEACGFKVVQKSYPIFTGKYFSFDFFINRLFRKSLILFNADQELLVVAQKI